MRSTAFALLFACACGPMAQDKHPETASNGSADPDTKMVCHNVADTGTLVEHQECHPVQRDKDEHDDSIRQMTKPTSQPTMGK